MGKSRRSFTAEQKAEIVRRHLKDRVAVSDLADELGIQPSQIHQWVAAFLNAAEGVFTQRSANKGVRSRSKLEDIKDRHIKRLEEKLKLKNELMAA